jgi:F-type H+-transporting ATPase subunit b
VVASFTALAVYAAADDTTAPKVLGIPWGELIIGIICFGILLFVLGKYAWPMFEKAYAARTEAIEGGLAKAEQAQNDAAAALAEYQRQLAGAREEAAKIREDARLQAQGIHDDMVAKAHAETERIAAAGRAQLEAQRSQVVAELRAELGRTSVELASKVVGESLTDQALQNRTVERFLAELER